jgi:hypothetical protein
MTVKRLQEQRIASAKATVAIKIQCHYRRNQALKVYKRKLEEVKAVMIQSYLRKRLAKRKVKMRLAYKAKVILIQRFYRRRYRSKRQRAILV